MAKATANIDTVRKVFRILVTMYCCFAIVAAVGTLISFFIANDLLAHAVHANGQVIKLEPGSKGTFAPVVQLKTANGELLQLKSFLSTSPAPRVGDNVPIVYRNSNPRDWRIDDWINLYFWTMIGAIFTFVWAIAAIIVKLVGDHQDRKLNSVRQY